MKRSESTKNLMAALVKAMSEMGTAKKDSNNPFFKSKYADINALREVALPVLYANGITVLQPPTFIDGVDFIETTIEHTSGEFISSLNRVVLAKQNDPQAFLAAQTYTRRGALQSFLCMGAEDDDGNGISGRSTTKVNNSESNEQEPQPEAPKGRFSRRK